ncbi:MAG: EAL domain-containing protein [Reyranella sp.]|uniref:putative bifunctional diguanylate cyclase/phosphodiesterase n=1 Tax=Reyranella sp. TaxID=1929291 RepID=UPI0011FF2464|nr:EAL domain-containing protein [Reyranella sp.]TAJ97761.1 MAG: EAL domain-containing protein [Reyranella sp.]TBR22565.1 MAG: EAL domain-containing protein [Reyranella sp.]
MLAVARCIATEHDAFMIALAALVCSLGTVVVTQMFEQARTSRAMARMYWIVLTGVAAGATIWCTHFVSMMGYAANAAVRIDPLLTVFSLMIAVAGTSLGLWVAVAGANLRSAAIGGALVGAAAAAMHFLGMAGYHIDGLIHWRLEYVAAAPLLSMALAGAAFVVLCGDRVGRARVPLAAGLLVAGILSMHFTAMTAMQVASFAPDESSTSSDGRHALGLATALVGVIAMAASIAAALVDRRTRVEAFRHVRRLAMTDALTGLTNRPGFNEALNNRLAAAERAGTKLAVVAIDLDRFKEVNDLYGHKAGDDVLATLARRMSEQLRAEDLIARLGGDEFVALVECRSREELLVPLRRLEVALTAQVDLEGFAGSVGASIGVAVYPDDALTVETLSTNADLAMYRAKREGASEPCFYDAGIDEAARRRIELAHDLRMAVQTGTLELHYQPQSKVRTGEVIGYEALLRWKRPTLGSVPPSVFIPVAEEHGLMVTLGEWVLRRACADATRWPRAWKLSVNVSSQQLNKPGLFELCERVLRETGLPAHRLELELTETAIMENRERGLDVLRRIQALGVSVALDDFGTGYSSLEIMRRFRFDKIKLDRFFASELGDSTQALAIVRAVLELGRSMSIPVLAEGIETRKQLDILIREGCEEAQGYLLGRPVPLKSLFVEDAVSSGPRGYSMTDCPSRPVAAQ